MTDADHAPVEDEDDDAANQTVVAEIRLEGRAEGERPAVDALGDATLVEADIAACR